jgi:hypothetical protein
LGNVSQTLPGQFDFSNISFTPTTVVGAVVGAAYTQQLTIGGGYSPYGNITIVTGNLPANLSLSITTNDIGNEIATANITGTPTTFQTANFTVQSIDAISNTSSITTTQAYTLDVALPTITISPSSLTNAVVGKSYAQAFTANGGTGPYTYSNVGNLPPSLTLSNTGSLTGNITTTATPQSITIRATDSYNSTGNSTYSLNIARPTISVTGTVTANMVVGTPYTTTITATGGTTPYAWTTSNPSILAAGLSLSGATSATSTTGTVTFGGTPTANGSFTFAISATDLYSTEGLSNNYSVNIARPTVTVTPSSLSGATTGSLYTANITATGGVAPYTFSVTGNTLPPALTLSNTTGVLSGIVLNDSGQPFNFTITAYDSYNSPGNINYSLPVTDPAITITPTTLANGVVGLAYSQTLNSTANGVNTGPYTYSVTGGTLPANITLSTSGNLTGTPTVNGNSTFTVTSTDSFASQGSFTYANVNIALPTIILSPNTLPSVTVGNTYAANIVAFGGTSPYTFSVTGGVLPDGLDLSAGGQITGTTTDNGTFDFTVTATDSYASTGARPYSIAVTTPTITITPLTIPNGEVGVAYSQTFTASGSTGPYTFTADNLPAGLSLFESTGGLSGAPTESGYQPFTVTATDPNGYTGTQLYNFVAIPNIPTSAIEVYIGGIRQTSGYTVTSKSPATVAFDTPPPANVAVTVAVRQGVSWYQPGLYTASDGQPLQETDTPAARFLRGVN